MKYLIVSVIVALLAVIFAIQNPMVVAIAFLGWTFEMSLAVVILGAAIFGAIVVWPTMLYMQLRLKWQLKKAQQAQSALEGENKLLKEKVEKLEKPAAAEAVSHTASEKKGSEG